MANANGSSASPKPRRWLKILAGLAAVFVVLVVVGYLWLTSSAFFKSTILPRVSRALDANVTVSDAAIHPFSSVTLRDLKVQAAGQEPLVTAPEIRLRYHLWDILHGNLRVDEVTLVSPVIEVVENPDGSRNLDPILKALQAQTSAPAKPTPPPPPGKAAKPLKIDVAKVTLSNAEFRQIKNYSGGQRDVVAVTNLNFTLANLKNGQTAALDLSAGLEIAKNSTNAPAGFLAAAVKGNFKCAFSPELKLDSSSGDASFSVSQAGGAFADFDAFGAAVTCDVTPTDIKQLALRFQKSGTPLGELAVSGPFDSAKQEGKLDVALRGIDRRLLNLFGERSGIDFGTTTIDATTHLELAKAGAAITATGKFAAGKFQVTRAGQTTPTLDLSADYDVAVDRAAQTATLRSLNLAGTQNATPLLDARLSSPMNLGWGSNASNLGDAAFHLTVTDLNLADWKPFLGSNAPVGTVGVNLQVASHAGGQQITFDLKSDVANLAMRVGSNHISQAAVNLSAQGQAAQFKQVTLSASKLALTLQNQPAVTASAAGTYDLGNGDADLQIKLQAALARLLQALPQPGMNVSSGDVDLNAHVTQKQKTQTIIGDLTLNNFDGQVGKNEFHNFGSKLNLDIANSPEQVQINKLSGGLSQNGNAGGGFELSGAFKSSDKSVTANAKFSSLNENALRPFLQPLLAGKSLASVTLSGDVSARYQPQGGSDVKGNVQLSNLVVKDPKQPLPATPLAAGFQIDAALNQQIADVRQFQISLTPTSRAKNQFQFSGQVDMSNTNAMQGNLKLAADSLDLTSYYDLFIGGTNASAKTAATATVSATPPARASEEPAAVKLPLQNFTLTANVGQFYLHEVAITNFQTMVKIDGGHVVAKPFQLALNGAPVNATADVDLGVPGYKYKVAFDAKSIPLAPLVNTFQPARAGQMGGTLTANAQIAGAGITGASLQKNLAGQFDLDLTNLNLSVINLRSPILKTVINVVATIPEILSKPENAIASLLGGITGQGSLMNELQQSPVESISARTTAGNGTIHLRQATVQSAAFKADAAGGSVALNSVLTNSTINIPVTVSLSQAIASRLDLAGSATNLAYVPLPQFLTLAGTVGQPKANINKMALAGATIRNVGEKLLNTLGTNTAPVQNLLNQFFNPK